MFNANNHSIARHWCDQNDRLKYGWTYHDGETFAIEDIRDNYFQLRIEWIKQVTGQHGGDWTARIHVSPRVCSQLAR
jgi:mannosyl-oligosaccharide glucosidase